MYIVPVNVQYMYIISELKVQNKLKICIVPKIS